MCVGREATASRCRGHYECVWVVRPRRVGVEASVSRS